MCILNRPAGRVIFVVGQQGAEAVADFLEALAEISIRIGEGILEAPPPDVARDLCLLGCRCRDAVAIQSLDDVDSCDVLACFL